MKKIIIFSTTALLAVFVTAKWLGIYWNVSDSYPPGLYQRTEGKPERDQLGMVCLPQEVAVKAVDRGYVKPGIECPGGAQPILKKVAGLQGDLIEYTGEGVEINGALYRNTQGFPRDGAGNVMPRLTGIVVIPEGYLLVLSDYNPLSYDGRYFGVIPEAGYLGGAKALIQW